MLYRRFEGKELSPKYLKPLLDEIIQYKDPYCFIDDMIVNSNRKITTIVRHNF